MQCKCGGYTTNSTHQVTTLKKALEWADLTVEDNLPLTISQDRCIGCGRLHYVVSSKGVKMVEHG